MLIIPIVKMNIISYNDLSSNFSSIVGPMIKIKLITDNIISYIIIYMITHTINYVLSLTIFIKVKGKNIFIDLFELLIDRAHGELPHIRLTGWIRSGDLDLSPVTRHL